MLVLILDQTGKPYLTMWSHFYTENTSVLQSKFGDKILATLSVKRSRQQVQTQSSLPKEKKLLETCLLKKKRRSFLITELKFGLLRFIPNAQPYLLSSYFFKNLVYGAAMTEFRYGSIGTQILNNFLLIIYHINMYIWTCWIIKFLILLYYKSVKRN